VRQRGKYAAFTRRGAGTRNRHPVRAWGDARPSGPARLDREPGAGVNWWRFGDAVEHLDSRRHSRHPAAFYIAIRSRSKTESAGVAVYTLRRSGFRAALWGGAGVAGEPS